jgi:hypothetical protein
MRNIINGTKKYDIRPTYVSDTMGDHILYFSGKILKPTYEAVVKVKKTEYDNFAALESAPPAVLKNLFGGNAVAGNDMAAIRKVMFKSGESGSGWYDEKLADGKWTIMELTPCACSYHLG